VAIEVEEGETVEVGTIVAYIDTEGGAVDEAAADGAAEGEAEEEGGEVEKPAAAAPEAAEAEGPSEPAEADQADQADGADGAAEASAAAEADQAAAETEPAGDESAEDRLRTRSTPVVRRIAEEHGVDISRVPGSGHAGRVTKQDILDFIESGEPAEAEVDEPIPAPDKKPARAERPAAAAPAAPSVEPSEFWKTFYGQVQHPEFPVRAADTVEAMDKIRRLTAEHMVLAKRVAPHVHSFIEVDFTAVDRIRNANKKRWSEQGARVSYTAFVAWACSRVLREFPTLNATVSGNNIIYRGSVNVGMAVDLDPGLIVPVMHDTDDLGLVGIGKKIIDLAERARARQLQPAEIQGATFSITNPGVLGTLVGMPVIPKGTSAILGTGAIEKRVVVVEGADGADTIAIRKRSLFSLGYDHRVVDGADAARFLARLKEVMEDFPEDA
jgi:2-oxoglutarate dehydrogenase E2 component (dihydrolipoamide succinyltransferase)